MDLSLLGASIKAVAEKAIELLREGERKRGQFFDAVVEPLHSNFLELKAGHTRTLDEVSALVKAGGRGPLKAQELVQQRSYTEEKTWNVLHRVASDPSLGTRNEVAAAFREYTSILLSIIHRDLEPDRYQITVYESLQETLERIINTAARDKASAAQEIERIYKGFVLHCADEEVGYLKLRRLCKG